MASAVAVPGRHRDLRAGRLVRGRPGPGLGTAAGQARRAGSTAPRPGRAGQRPAAVL